MRARVVRAGGLFVFVAVLAIASRALAPSVRALPALDDSALLHELRARAVTERDFVRTELWTWTSAAQVRALARGAPLLTAHAGDGALRSPYQRALDALAQREDAPGALARSLSSRARRYAWTTPYGTAIALGARSYGPALVRIRVREDAWHALFAPEEEVPLRIVDGRGNAIPIAAALAEPERIATVHHVRTRAPSGGFREIVVHGGVESFSIDPHEARARIAVERRVLAALSRHRRRARAPIPRSMVPLWSEAIGADALSLFAQTMPFDTPRHRATEAGLAGLVRALIDRE